MFGAEIATFEELQRVHLHRVSGTCGRRKPARQKFGASALPLYNFYPGQKLILRSRAFRRQFLT